jgi:hypothetical protein
VPSEPLDSFASANTRPQWASMIDQQIDSPIPTPLDFVPGSSAGSTSTGIVPPDPLAAPPTASTGSPRAASGSKARGVGWEFVHIPSTTPSPSLARETTISALSPFSGQPSLNLRTWTRGSNSRLRSRNGREPAHQAILRLPTRAPHGKGVQRRFYDPSLPRPRPRTRSRESLPWHLGGPDTGL